MAESLTKMTILELTRLISAQDDRWAAILTYARSTKHPLAQQGIAFFKHTWRRFMSEYYENVAGRYDSAAKAPVTVVKYVLDKMADVVYPAARAVGLGDTSFLIPDITIEKGGGPAIVAGQSWMYW